MAYSNKEKENILKTVCERIVSGEAVRNILKDKDMPAYATFFDWIDEDKEKLKQYARAKELYAESVFEDIILISDGSGDDLLIDENGIEQVNHQVIQRDRLRVDSRKWALSKMNPKKYGDKLDLTSKDEKIQIPILTNDPLSDDTSDNGIKED
jgi:hypothetical protein